jgi:tRNA-specific 2-thiouridylase
MNFISGKEFVGSCRARVRYRQPLSAATLSKNENGNYLLSFVSPQKFVAEGQSAVFYSKEGEMLGGGVIV